MTIHKIKNTAENMKPENLSLYDIKCLRYLAGNDVLMSDTDKLTIDWAEALVVSGYKSNNAYILASLSLDKYIDSYEVEHYFDLLCKELEPAAVNINMPQAVFCLFKQDLLRIADADSRIVQCYILSGLIYRWYDINHYIFNKMLTYLNQSYYYHYDYLVDIEGNVPGYEERSFIEVREIAERFYRLLSQLEAMNIPR